jgi:fibronectin-binding autotransporter adhesin
VELLANGSGDRINAGGRAVIEGGTVAVTAADPARSYTDGALYRILNATGGLTGRFSGITGSSAFLDFSLLYDATGADVRVAVLRQFPDVARTFNQRQTSTGLRDFNQAAGSDSRTVYRTILFLEEDPARASFDASSGEIYASVIASAQRQGAGLAGQFAARGHDGAGTGWRLWGGVNGDTGSVASDGNGGRFTYGGIGGTLGLDYRSANGLWAVGVGGGNTDGTVSLNARQSRANVDGWHVGGYARLGATDAGPNGTISVAHARTDAVVNRTAAFGDLRRSATATTDVETTALTIDLRYGFSSGNWTAGPIAAVEHQSTNLGSFVERGADSLNLSSTGSDRAWTRYSAGGFLRLADGRGTIDASTRLVWGSRDDSRANLMLAGALATPFQVRAATGSEIAALYTLAGEYTLGGGWSIGGDVRGSYGQSERSISGSATVRLAF